MTARRDQARADLREALVLREGNENIDRAVHPDFDDVVTENDKYMRLYRIAQDRAVAKIGKEIFYFQPKVIQRALVSEEILVLLNAQDEDEVPDARVRQMAMALWQINGTV